MINSFSMANYGPISGFKWTGLDKINLIIGGNGLGKTFALKSVYSAIKAIEDYKRGDNPKKLNDILAEKMYWTFQVEKLGDLKSKGAVEKLKFSMKCSEGSLEYSFSEKTTTSLVDVEEKLRSSREANSVFIPAKEVLSLFQVIAKTRDENLFGFDDTYFDLVKALSRPTQKGKNYKTFSDARERLAAMLMGKVNFDSETGRWTYARDRGAIYSIQATSEGIKKIAILDTLLGNRYLTPESVIFIDEPESALHPHMLTHYLDIISRLADQGIQFFIASHSYFVIKKLLLISKQKKCHIPVLSLEAEGARLTDMIDGMPDNAIIDESIELYDEEVEASLR